MGRGLDGADWRARGGGRTGEGGSFLFAWWWWCSDAVDGWEGAQPFAQRPNASLSCFLGAFLMPSTPAQRPRPLAPPLARSSSTRSHICAAEGAFSVAQWLLDSGADPNPPDRHGRTPLEEAVRHDHAEVARLLQAHRARVMEDGHLVALEASRLRGLVNTRAGAMADIGWDPEWEVSPKELKLIERIGEQWNGGGRGWRY